MITLRNKNRGITLIALVITIVILLILAGISIAQLTGNGLFEKAKLAKEKSENAQIEENTTLADYENKINSYIGNSRNTVTSYKVLYDNPTGATSGTLNESINNFDILIAIYGSPVRNTARNSKIFTPECSTIEINFVDVSGALYGIFVFNDKKFDRTIDVDNRTWEKYYLMYKVMGIKF